MRPEDSLFCDSEEGEDDDEFDEESLETKEEYYIDDD